MIDFQYGDVSGLFATEAVWMTTIPPPPPDKRLEDGPLLRRDVPRGFRIHHQHIRLRELIGGGKIQRAIGLHPALREQHFPIIEEALVFVRVRPVRFHATADEDAQRIGLRELQGGEEEQGKEREETFHNRG
ncbi:MAG: hypothetical protein WDN28_31905 [Chthoniobacter sp.]